MHENLNIMILVINTIKNRYMQKREEIQQKTEAYKFDVKIMQLV